MALLRFNIAQYYVFEKAMARSEVILLMAEVLHHHAPPGMYETLQMIGINIPLLKGGFIHPRWCRISAINRSRSIWMVSVIRCN